MAMSSPVVSMVDPSPASILSEAGRDRGRAASLSRPYHTKCPGGRKQACLSCRRRKRRCDGAYPSCSACVNNRSKCAYVWPNTTPSANRQQGNPFDLGTGTEGNLTWSTLSPIRASTIEPNFNTDGSYGGGLPSNYDNGSPGLWSLGLESRFSMQQDVQRSSEYFSIALEHPSATQGWLANASMEIDNLGTGQPVRNESNNTGSSGYEPGEPDSRHFVPESRASTSSRSALEGSYTRSDKGNTTAATTPKSVVGRDAFLPSFSDIMELVDIFFSQYHFYLPCIHKKTFVDRVKRGSEFGQPPTALTWALLGVAAPDHPDPHIRLLGDSWIGRARTMVEESQVNTMFPTQSLQASVWILFKAFIQADFTDAWLFLSKVCRLASLFGFDCIDSSQARRFRPTISGPRDNIEQEEQRKIMWILFFFDRNLSCLAGLPLAIDDRHFEVNFPLEDDHFQAATYLPDRGSQSHTEAFAMDLSKVVSTSVLQNLRSKVSMNHVLRASVLLGRIVNFHCQLHMSPGDGSQELADLENVTSLFTFAWSREGNEREGFTQRQLGLLCWLDFIIQTCNILLHHPKVPAPIAGDLSPRADPKNSRAFQTCISSMRRIVDGSKEMNNNAPLALSNPFLVMAHFLSCRFLAMNWHDSGNQSDRDDIDFILMLIDRIGSRWPKLAKKFSKGIMMDLAKTGEEAIRMRIGTGSYLDVGCA